MNTRDIVAIGGSTGATKALTSILGRLPAAFPAAVFVVVHIPARSVGILATVARAASALPVVEAADGLRIEAGRVYVAVPDRHLLIEGDRIRLGLGPRENMARPAIDPLFRSAAVSFGPRAIGIVLSGMLSDGAVGLHAIKTCGGAAIVQDPADALADEMPRRALEATAADFCLPAADIADVVVDLVRQPAGPPAPVPPQLKLEVEIAAGEQMNSQRMGDLADPVALTCPACGGVMSQIRGAGGLRFRCQVGHGFAADVLAKEQEGGVDEALRVSLRIVGERSELMRRMAADARASGRTSMAQQYEERGREYAGYAETIRRAVLGAAGEAPSADA